MKKRLFAAILPFDTDRLADYGAQYHAALFLPRSKTQSYVADMCGMALPSYTPQKKKSRTRQLSFSSS